MKPGMEQNGMETEVIVVHYGCGCWTHGQKFALIRSLSMCTNSDLSFCNSYEDGTGTKREPCQVYKTAEVGHSQL